MRFEFVAEIFHRTRERFNRAGGMQTERVAGRADQLSVRRNDVEIARLPAPRFEIGQQLFEPRQAFAARRAEAARFLREEVLEVARQIDDAH